MSQETNERIRPITTGDIGVANIGRHRFRVESSSVYASIIPDDDPLLYTVTDPHAAEVKVRRPRALHHPVASTTSQARGSAESRRVSRETQQSTQHRPPRERRIQRERGEGDRGERERGEQGERITDLWASLNHFSRNNLGRSLKEEAEEELADKVHFV
ncbi:hypothetical protein EON64_05040, partial [archaeon]